MDKKILDFLKKYNILNSQKTFLVGFSGGQDSLCLIDILHKMSKEFDFKIVAAHLNHNWRGESSKKEQCSCLEYCKSKNIDFFTKTLDDSVKKTEENARIERYKFFEEIAIKANADGVFTAHTKTDNAETILYRIIKGTGVFGLCAIPEVRQEKAYKLYRPMLEITREETGLYCFSQNLTPASDESNFDKKYARNNLRLNIIPLLKEINPNFENAIENLSKTAKDYDEILSKEINGKAFSPVLFKDYDEARKRVFVHKFLIENNLEYDFRKVQEIVDFINKNITKTCGNTISLTTNKWLFASKEKIEIIFEIKSAKIDEVLPLKINENNHFQSLNKVLTIKDFDVKLFDKFPKENEYKAFVNLPKNLVALELRTRREGDIIQPFGLSGTMKLKKFFINKGIPEHERDKILLISSGNEVLWAIGVGLSEKLRVGEKPTHIIELR